jgi:hypothetical protein
VTPAEFDPRPLLFEIAAVDGRTVALRDLASRLSLDESAAVYATACRTYAAAEGAVRAACRTEGADLTAALDCDDEALKRMRDAHFVLGLVAERGAAAPVSAAPTMLDALRHCIETGDALRPAAWGPGFHLLICPTAGFSLHAVDGRVQLEHARLRNPATRADHPLDLEEMLGPWVTLPIKDAQLEAATRAADGEEVR